MPSAPPLHSRRLSRAIAPFFAYLGIAVLGCALPQPLHAQELMPASAAGWTGFAARPASAPGLSTPAGSPYGLEISGNGVPAVYGGWRTQLSGLTGNQFYRFRARAFPTGLTSPREAITILLRWHGAFGDEVAPDYVWQFATQADGSLTFDRVVQAPPGTSSADVELVLQWASNGSVRFDSLSFAPAASPASRPVKIAAMSFRPQGTASGLDSVQRAAQFGDGVAATHHPDVMVFGELLNVIGAPGSYDVKAEAIPGASTDVMSALARNNNTYVVFGMLERENQLLYNTAVLIDRSGAIVAKHRKVQLPLAELSGGIFPGDTVSVLQTDFGRVSLLICQDTAFPEPARDAAIRGAELLLVPIWGGKSAVVAARAIEQSVYVAASGYDYLSEVVDPLGTPLARVPVLNTPDVAVATIDLAHRFREDWSGDWRDVSGKQRRTAPYTADPDSGANGPPPPPPNSPPSVSIDSPSAGATFTAPATIAIGASAFDSDGTVTRVDFYAGTSLVGSDTTSPFQVTWSNVPAGSYALTARATDDDGAMTMSTAVNVTVSSGGAALPAPWQTSDIGAVGQTGTASATNGTFTIEGGGADIWGTADAFRYVWQPISGDVDVIARVVSVENVAAWVKVGVMIREQLTPDSAHALMLVSAGKGLAYQRRVATGGISTSTSGIAGTAPAWVKLERRGNTITASYSFDGASWTVTGFDAFAMGANVYVGLAVSSHTTSDLATGTLDNVAIVQAVLPSPWQSRDVGAVGVAGDAHVSNGTFTVRGSGADVWGTADAFQYVWRQMSGDGDVIARVASVENVAAWVKAGVMIRADITAEAAQAFMLVSAGKGLAFQRRVASGGLSTSTSGGTGVAPAWVKLERRGGIISAYSSADGVNWSLVGNDAFTMGTTVYVGLAVSSHDNTRLATATFDNVTVR